MFEVKWYNDDMMKGASIGALGVMADSVWSNSHLFREYLGYQFIPHVGGGGTEDSPILVIFDGHALHVSPQLIE